MPYTQFSNTGNGNLLTLQGPTIVLGSLASARKPLNMPYSSVALTVLQSLYINRIKSSLRPPTISKFTKKLTEKGKQKCNNNIFITKSPSIMYLETSSLRVMISSWVSSFVNLLSMLISHKICRALLLPTPWMYCSEYSIRLLFGISTSPTRAHLMLNPWTCTHTSNSCFTVPNTKP